MKLMPTTRGAPSTDSVLPAFLLRTLGAAELCEIAPGGAVLPRVLGPGKPLALLVYCACARDRAHARDMLAALLWADSDPEKSRHNVRQALWRLRRVLGDVLVTRDDAVEGIHPALESDRERFLRAVHGDDAELALLLYSGPFLRGLTLPGGDEFEDWAIAERRRLEDSLLRVVQPYARELVKRDRPGRVCEVAERLIVLAPDSLDAHRIATDLLVAAGDRSAARRVADRLEQLAVETIGHTPTDAAAAIARARTTATVEPVEIVRAIALDLVGRDAEFGAVLEAWSRARVGTTQVVAMTGIAGIGKSRLLAAIATRCSGRRARSVSVRANPGELEVPFGFAAGIARALSTQPGAAGINVDSAREIVALDPGLGSVFATTPSATDGGEAVRRRALALLDLVSAIAEQEPLALLLDDLHWADASSRQLLAVVLGRATELPLMVVVTTRATSAVIVEHRALTTVSLLALDGDAVIDAIRSSGSWPEHAEAQLFVRRLASVCDGIPLSVVERLALARDTGNLVDHDGMWDSPDWQQATRDIGVASPLDQRLLACTPIESRTLLTLSVAGTPLADAVIRDALPKESASTVADALQALEVKGLLVRTRDGWSMWHDVVSERTLALTAPEDRQARHGALATALMLSGSSLSHAAAVRHFVQAMDDDAAGVVFAKIVAAGRRSGDARHARDVLTDCVGERLSEVRLRRVLRAVPFWNRSARLRTRSVLVAASLVVLATSVSAWYARRQPALAFAQAPVVAEAARSFRSDAFRLLPSAIVRFGSSERVLPAAAGSSMVHVRSLRATATILSGDSVVADSGVASFGALRFATTDSVLILRFEAEGFRPLDFELKMRDNHLPNGPGRSSTRLYDGMLNGQHVRGPNAQIVVARDATVSGVVQVEYNSSWPAASVWLSLTPTWGRASEVGREIIPVSTPVRQDVVDVPVDVVAPHAPGQYWILFMVDAEPSGGFGLSRTNWTLGAAEWGDGNDLAALPDSVIRVANRDGIVLTDILYPALWNTGGYVCRDSAGVVHGKRVKYCPRQLGMFGIRVIVN